MVSPEIVSLGPLQLRWYGVCVALGLVAGYVVACLRAKRYGMDSSKCADLVFTAMIFGLIGARIEYVRREWFSMFQDDWLGIFRIWEGGISFQGGLILATIALAIMCKIRKWNTMDIADLSAPALAVGHAFGRLGCLLNGCCYGKEWEGILAVHYDCMDHGVLAIQAFEIVLCLFIAGLLLTFEYHKMQRGRLFPIYLIVYSIGRFFIEYGRGDYLTLGQSEFTPAQSLFLFVCLPIGIVWYSVVSVYLKTHRAKNGK